MNRKLGSLPILATPFALAIAGMPTPAVGSETIGEQEGLDCQVCHANVEAAAETLTDRGLYYQYLRTLDGYAQVLEKFESCTYCHADGVGSQGLTPEGHRFRWMMEDMVGLRAWLEENHPRPQDEGDSSDDPG